MLSQWLQKPTDVKPYSQLAFIYDYVMRHVNYDRWAQYLQGLFLNADILVKEVLDIACGTGNLLLKLIELDFKVAGFDVSENMIKIAQEKAQKRGLSIPIWQGVMENFKVKKPFHACLCTYDSMNYCMNLNACYDVLRHASDALCSGGVFIFDICTEKNSRNNFRNFYEKDQTDNFQYIRRTDYLKKEKIQINEFIISLESNSNAPFRELHQQRIYRIDEILNIIPLDQFKIVGIYDGFSKHPGTEKSDRVHFVLKKFR
ncbi:MAG: class I SAM-dependent DNA methyltransferase [bacterium]